MSNNNASSLTRENVLAAIKVLSDRNSVISHATIRNQVLVSGFKPTANDLAEDPSGTFVWLRTLTAILKELRAEGSIEAYSTVPGGKATKYRLPQPKPEEKPRQIGLPLTECTSRDVLLRLVEEVEEIKGLLREICDRLPAPVELTVSSTGSKVAAARINAGVKTSVSPKNRPGKVG